MNPEPIAVALLERVAKCPSVKWATRYRVGIEKLMDYPAAIVGMDGANVRAEHGLPGVWTLNFSIGFIARADGSEESPESVLNTWLVELQAALAPDTGEETLTLGGLCDHAWISGAVEYAPPSSEFPWMECWTEVEVLAIG